MASVYEQTPQLVGLVWLCFGSGLSVERVLLRAETAFLEGAKNMGEKGEQGGCKENVGVSEVGQVLL